MSVQALCVVQYIWIYCVGDFLYNNNYYEGGVNIHSCFVYCLGNLYYNIIGTSLRGAHSGMCCGPLALYMCICVCIYVYISYIIIRMVRTSVLYFVHHICVCLWESTQPWMKLLWPLRMPQCISCVTVCLVILYCFRDGNSAESAREGELGNFVGYTRRKCTSWIRVGGGPKEGHVWRQRRWLCWSWSLVVVVVCSCCKHPMPTCADAGLVRTYCNLCALQRMRTCWSRPLHWRGPFLPGSSANAPHNNCITTITYYFI